MEQQRITKQQRAEREQRRFRSRVMGWKSILFFGFLFVMSLIGLLWFARPSVSTVEKRELTEFPRLTLSGFWDGSWFSEIDTWYADTYPLRELLISMDNSAENLYGIRSEQLVGTDTRVAEEIPEGTVDLEALASETRQTEATQQTQPSEIEGKGDAVTPAETAGTVYITENCGYDVYYFEQQPSARYCLLVNRLAQELQGVANVYDLIAPTASGIMLSDSVRKGIGGSDAKEAINWMYEQMSPEVKKVSVYHALKCHNDEYIYFHTDHHWTALGAYYAYREFCSVKGVAPHELTNFQTYEFPNFLGTFYYSSNQNAALGDNPDTLIAYIPNGTNSMTMQMANNDDTFTEYTWSVVNDVSAYARSELYSCFAGGDQPYNYAHNEKIKDGSSVLVVKDSYANAFIPFLIDHYEHIYWIDYRSYNRYCSYAGIPDSSISALVRSKSINDVLLLNNINSTGSDGFLGYMETLFQ